MAIPDLSVIVPTLNARDTIDRALNSIAREVGGVSGHVEILVIDGGSQDGTVEIVATYPQVVLCQQTSSGLAGARNEGISKSYAPLVAFCDADDMWVDGSLAKKLNIMSTSPDIWGVTGWVQFEDVTTATPGLPPRRRAGEQHRGYTPGALIVRRHALEAVTFDERLALAADTDWFIRAISKFGELVHLDETVLRKGLRVGSLSTDVQAYRKELLGSARRYLHTLRNGHS